MRHATVLQSVVLAAVLSVVSVAATAGALAQSPQSQVTVWVYFDRSYENRFPGPEVGEDEIVHANIITTGMPGVRVRCPPGPNCRRRVS